MNVLDLFSGIGGFSLGLERAGMRTVAFCEIDPFCRRVLAKHWPHVPCYDDVRTLTAERLRADGISVDAICGGFPCQDISSAGKRAGITGSRSGLWSEYGRLVGELRPRVVVVENVGALLIRGFDTVVGDLAALGYDLWWDCISASAVGAPHQRDRVWIVAYARGEQHQGYGDALRGQIAAQLSRAAADAPPMLGTAFVGHEPDGNDARSQAVGDAEGERERAGLCEAQSPQFWQRRSGYPGWWSAEPAVDRMAYGVSNRVDRLRGLGNAVVPQIPEAIGRAILAAEGL